MDDENELENQSIDIPIWKRYLLSGYTENDR